MSGHTDELVPYLRQIEERVNRLADHIRDMRLENRRIEERVNRLVDDLEAVKRQTTVAADGLVNVSGWLDRLTERMHEVKKGIDGLETGVWTRCEECGEEHITGMHVHCPRCGKLNASDTMVYRLMDLHMRE